MTTEEQLQDGKREASAMLQYVAHLVKAAREQRGWTQEDVGRRSGYTAAAISQLERCQRPPSEVKLVKLDEVLFDGKEILTASRDYLRMERHPHHFQGYAGLEATAVSIASYQTLLIDGLFQTEAYARAVLECAYPPHEPEEIEKLLSARMDRKAVFSRKPPPLLELVLEESTLRRQVGTPETMRDQLRDLAEQAKLPNVTIQVMPMNRAARGQHAGLRGSVTVVVTEEHQTVAYMETGGEGMLITSPAKVSTHSQRFRKIQAQALGPDESLALIEQLAEEWEQQS